MKSVHCTKTMIAGRPAAVKKKTVTRGVNSRSHNSRAEREQNENGLGNYNDTKIHRAAGADHSATLHTLLPFRGSSASRRTGTGTEPLRSTPWPFPFCSAPSDGPESLTTPDGDAGHQPWIREQPREAARLGFHHVEQGDDGQGTPAWEITVLPEPRDARRCADQQVAAMPRAPRSVLDGLLALGDLTRVRLPDRDREH